MKTNDIYNSLIAHKKTLEETSLDDSKIPHVYMTNSQHEVIDFDLFKEEYARTRGIDDPCSCDAILLDKNNELNFIEFKNLASIRNFNKAEIKEKVYCSLLIFSDKVSHTISKFASHINFICVYNKEIDNKKTKKNVQTSASSVAITTAVSSYAETPIIRFGFESLKEFCFKEVYTFTQDEFEEHLEKIIK